MSENWVEYRRGLDGELLGWIKPVGDGFVVVDLLGREKTSAIEWLDAEEVLDDLGLGYLADPYELRLDNGEWLRVRISEVSTQWIRVKRDDGGDVNVPEQSHTLPFPAPQTLRPFRR